MPYTLSLGPVRLAWHLDSADPRWREFLAGYEDYLDKRPGQLTIEAALAEESGHPAPPLPNSFIRYRRLTGRDFDLGDGLIRGQLVADDLCRCELHPVLLRGCGLRVLEQFFYLLFYHVVLAGSEPTPRMPFLLHSSTVLHEGRAFVFCGPAGSGKSTAAELSTPRSVLTDECTVFEPDATRLTIAGSPINPFCRDKRLGGGPLAGLYLLQQALDHHVRAVSRQSALPRLAAEVITPLGLLEAVSARGLARALDCALLLYDLGRVRELHFRRDADFWTAIAAENPA